MAESFQSAQKARPEPGAARSDGARVLVLGLNAWMVLAVLPMWFAEPRAASSVAWLLLPLPALLVGSAMLPRSPTLAAWVLLGGYPVLLAGLVAAVPGLVSQSPYSSAGLALGALSLVAFGAGAAFAATRPARMRPTSRRPLGSVSPIDEPGLRVWMRRLLLGAAGLGALTVAVVAPSLGGTESYEPTWGDAAAEAAVLTAVVGGALGCTALALFVGPTLRAAREAAPSRRQVNRRVAALLFSVSLGVAFYWFYILRG